MEHAASPVVYVAVLAAWYMLGIGLVVLLGRKGKKPNG